MLRFHPIDPPKMTSELALMDISARFEDLEKQSKEKVISLEKQIFQLQEELKLAKVTPDTPARDLPCFLPYKQPDGRIFTSSIIHDVDAWFKKGFCTFKAPSRCLTSTKDTDNPLNATVYPHEAIRRDMLEVSYLLKSHIKPDEPWKLVNFFEWYNSRFLKIVYSKYSCKVIFE